MKSPANAPPGPPRKAARAASSPLFAVALESGNEQGREQNFASGTACCSTIKGRTPNEELRGALKAVCEGSWRRISIAPFSCTRSGMRTRERGSGFQSSRLTPTAPSVRSPFGTPELFEVALKPEKRVLRQIRDARLVNLAAAQLEPFEPIPQLPDLAHQVGIRVFQGLDLLRLGGMRDTVPST